MGKSCLLQDLSHLNNGYARAHVKNCRQSLLRRFKRSHYVGGTLLRLQACAQINNECTANLVQCSKNLHALSANLNAGRHSTVQALNQTWLTG